MKEYHSGYTLLKKIKVSLKSISCYCVNIVREWSFPQDWGINNEKINKV
jgi:hypothetical protein